MRTPFSLICLFICCIVNAQQSDYYLATYPPVHPMSTNYGNRLDIKPDTVKSFNNQYPNSTDYIIHSYSDNGCTDTITFENSEQIKLRSPIPDIKYAYTFDKDNNKLILTEKYLRHPIISDEGDYCGGYYPWYVGNQLFYEYDSEGRLIKERSIDYFYDFKNDKTITFRDNIITYDLSTVNYIENGYIFNGVTYLFDEKDRLLERIQVKDTSKYVYYDDLDEHGYDLYIKRELGSSKDGFFFDKNGLLTKYLTYRRFLSGVTTPSSITDYSYHFSSKNPTSNSLMSDSPKIYGIIGNLIVNTEKPEWISVYSLSGQLIKKVYIQGNNQQIPLPKGIYIVKSDQNTTKVLVR